MLCIQWWLWRELTPPPNPWKAKTFLFPSPPFWALLQGQSHNRKQTITSQNLSISTHHNLECKFVSAVSHCKIIQPQVQVYHVAVNHVPQGPFVFAVDATVYAVSVDCLISWVSNIVLRNHHNNWRESDTLSHKVMLIINLKWIGVKINCWSKSGKFPFQESSLY